MAGPDIKNIDALPVPIPGQETPAPEPDTKKLDALLDSLNGSAERFQTLWFSFLGLTLYLAIAALTTTHKDLLLGEPKALPLLNIQVPLLPFYVIAPLLYLVFHFYLLMMLALLARTAAEFDKQLRTTLTVEADRERYRARVENALFLQLLVGMKGERSGVNALLMGLIALITIVLAPLATLILMQMMFLPYHHLRITWWHRGVVVADLVLIVVMTYRCFFPRGRKNAPLVLGNLSRKRRWAAAMAFCVLLAVGLFPVTYWLSFQQGRWAGEPSPSSFTQWTQWMEGTPATLPDVNPDYAATEDGVVFYLFPDRLELRNETIVGGTKLEETKKEIASRGADFVPTIELGGRDLQAAVLSIADLRGVSLRHAAMQGADLSDARLDGARLGWTDLRGADLSYARLPGADLKKALLLGTDLSDAQLQGAYLTDARLQGADLNNAQLQAASLTLAELQGANLSKAQLQGVFLGGAQMQGAKLEQAQLQGANLRSAQLQGADFRKADLADSTLDEAFVFRTDFADADLATTGVRSAHAEQVKPGETFGSPPRPLIPADVEVWVAAATQFAPVQDKTSIVERFARLKQEYQENGQKPTWSAMQEASLALDPDSANHRRRLATTLSNLACSPEGAPYVSRGLITPPFLRDASFLAARLASLGDQLGAVRARMEEGRKTPEKCPGVAGFIEADWRALEAIKPEAAPDP